MVMVNFLEASGAPAHPIFSGSNVLRAERIEGSTHGRVKSVNKEALEWCIRYVVLYFYGVVLK